MRPRHLVIAAGALLFLASGQLGIAGGATSSEGSTVVRHILTSDTGWTYSCRPSFCVGTGWVGAPIVTPEDAAYVDVTVSLTIDYRTSRGDVAGVELRYTPERSPRASVLMAPGRFTLSWPNQQRTSTTLVWAEEQVPAAGHAYGFDWVGRVQDADGDGSYAFSGTRFTMIVEMTRASG